MPRRSTISKLSSGIREQLDAKLRENAGLSNISDWLSDTHGISLGKSAIGVYSKSLKTIDRDKAQAIKELREVFAETSLTDLLAELVALKIRDQHIISGLESIDHIEKQEFDHQEPPTHKR
ncbi:hypothetical protein [Pseudomonas putida]|uniref:hypothetical protein n=1 Tax=Pseudomonas putida TaxID=303 RepID=UPI00300F01D6